MFKMQQFEEKSIKNRNIKYGYIKQLFESQFIKIQKNTDKFGVKIEGGIQ